MPSDNRSSPLRRCGLFLCAIAAIGCGDQGGMAPGADRILFNGKIITVDGQDTIAEALAIKDGRILAVGSDTEVTALAGPNTDRIDLRGFTATPGLLDAHAHFARGGVYLLRELDLSYPNVKSVAEAVNKVHGKADELAAGEWIFGRGWDEGKLAENRYIYASDLDPVTPEHPVYLSHTMGHYGVANSLALRMADITRTTPDPPGGTIDRGPDGEPTGVLKESAQSLVLDLMPKVDVDTLRQGIQHISQAFNREGMTGVKDPAIDADVWDAYQKVLAEGALTVRVFTLWRAGKSIEAAGDLIERIAPFSRPGSPGDDAHLISGGVKLFADGSGGARTGWLYEDWNRHFDGVDEGNRGYPAVDPDILRKQIRLFHDAGLHIGTHAVGDRAIDWVVDSYIGCARRETDVRSSPQRHSRQYSHRSCLGKVCRSPGPLRCRVS
jgi:predicted amidohydrolase YtcJ